MTSVDNAVALMEDDVLLKKTRAIEVFVARQVVIEPGATANHAQRLKMAQTAIYNPDQHLSQLRNIIACDPTIYTDYSTGVAIPDGTLLAAMQNLWTPVALMLYPATP